MFQDQSKDIVRDLGYLTLGSRLKRLGERLQSNTQRILDEHGLDVQAAQTVFLNAIERSGSLTVGELAESVGVSQPGATRTVGDLEDAGYVEIVQSSGDQRRKSVTLTLNGRRLVEHGRSKVWPLVERAVRDVCEELRGPLLTQLAAIEDALTDKPLNQRITKQGRRS